MNLSISELTFDDTGLYDELMRKTGFDIKVAIPAEITEVNFEKQTCKAQPTIRERLILRQENSKEYKRIQAALNLYGDLESGKLAKNITEQIVSKIGGDDL